MTFQWKWEMFAHVLKRSTRRQSRVETLATLVMWFAAGAFVTSTVAALFATHEPGQLIDLAGGSTAALGALVLKAL